MVLILEVIKWYLIIWLVNSIYVIILAFNYFLNNYLACLIYISLFYTQYLLVVVFIYLIIYIQIVHEVHRINKEHRNSVAL